MPIDNIFLNYHTYAFLGEAGCGKSEMAINTALMLARAGHRVRFFDMDMTKPLFRSRDAVDILEQNGIEVCFTEQYMDAPTSTIGLRASLRDPGLRVVLDVGGDWQGARAIGEYRQQLKGADTGIFYIINPYRAWAGTIEHIDSVLGMVLKSAGLGLENITFAANPNLGSDTCAENVVEGFNALREMLRPYAQLPVCMVSEDIESQVEGKIAAEIFPARLFIPYPWEN